MACYNPCKTGWHFIPYYIANNLPTFDLPPVIWKSMVFKSPDHKAGYLRIKEAANTVVEKYMANRPYILVFLRTRTTNLPLGICAIAHLFLTLRLTSKTLNKASFSISWGRGHFCGTLIDSHDQLISGVDWTIFWCPTVNKVTGSHLCHEKKKKRTYFPWNPGWFIPGTPKGF